MTYYVLSFCDQQGQMKKIHYTDHEKAYEAYTGLECPYKQLLQITVETTKLFEKNSVSALPS